MGKTTLGARDADVRLGPVTLRRARIQATTDGADLFSLALRLSCGCLAEWMVQPIMASLQLVLRLGIRRQFQVPPTFWWLMGAGGLVVAAIGPVSVWRTLSGRGWTWKGRRWPERWGQLLAAGRTLLPSGRSGWLAFANVPMAEDGRLPCQRNPHALGAMAAHHRLASDHRFAVLRSVHGPLHAC